MARITGINEGFESGNTLWWNAANGSNVSTNPRSGARCWLVGNGGDTKVLPASYSEFYFRWAHRFDSVNAAFAMLNLGTGSVIRVSRNADNSISVYSNGGATLLFTTTGFSLVANTYFLFELHVKLGGAGVGVTELKVDGVSRGSNSATANNQTASTIDRLAFVGVGGVERIDDLAFNDTTTGNDNSWPGDGHYIALAPNGAGNSTQFTPSAGSNYQNVDEVPHNSDTDYNSTSSTNQRDDFTLSDSGLSGVNIPRVWIQWVSKIDVADGSTLGGYLRSGGSDFDDGGGLQAQTLSYAEYRTQEWLTDPADSNPWSVTKVDALGAGYRT